MNIVHEQNTALAAALAKAALKAGKTPYRQKVDTALAEAHEPHVGLEAPHPDQFQQDIPPMTGSLKQDEQADVLAEAHKSLDDGQEAPGDPLDLFQQGLDKAREDLAAQAQLHFKSTSAHALHWLRANMPVGAEMSTEQILVAMGLPEHRRAALSGFMHHAKGTGMVKAVAKRGRYLVYAMVDPDIYIETRASTKGSHAPRRQLRPPHHDQGLPQLNGTRQEQRKARDTRRSSAGLGRRRDGGPEARETKHKEPLIPTYAFPDTPAVLAAMLRELTERVDKLASMSIGNATIGELLDEIRRRLVKVG